MEELNLFEALDGNDLIIPTTAIKQRWKCESHSYLDVPRPEHGFLLVTYGEIVMLTQNGEIRVKSGEIVFLPKNSRYKTIFEQETDDVLINFDTRTDFLPQMPFVMIRNAPIAVMDTFSLLTEEKMNGASSFKLKALFFLMLDKMSHCFFNQKNIKSETVERAKEILRENDNIKISEVARRCNISESGLRKRFNDESGISPAEYRLNCRLDKAKYILESSDMTVAEVSDMLGFCDSAYFCRHFKRRMGMSPKKYTKQKRL